MIVNLDFQHPTLIQTVRAKQAVMELGHVVNIKPGELKIYSYLKKYFPSTRYTFKRGKTVPVNLDHKEPFVQINGQKKVLIYPKQAFDLSKKFWNPKRTKVFFRGFVPFFREEALKQWEGLATIEKVDTGRKSINRFWDETYLTATGKAEFVLCPDGGWPWSYRFYEAVLCGAIPIVQTECDIYQGYNYFKWNEQDKLQYDLTRAIENFERARLELTIYKIAIG